MGRGGPTAVSDDPVIPPQLRPELVEELLDARRAVDAVAQGDDPDGREEAGARKRVQAAEVALGGRGEISWGRSGDDGRPARLRAAILALARHRGPGKTICPSDAARAVGGEEWRSQLSLAREVARDLAESGAVEITQRGEPIDPRGTWRGPVRIRVVETVAPEPMLEAEGPPQDAGTPGAGDRGPPS